MKEQPILETLDPEVAERIVSRRDALRSAGKLGAGLAFASVPVALGVLSRSAFAQGGLPQQVIDVLNFALTLEFLEAEFYNLGLAAPNLIPTGTRNPAGTRDVFDQIRKHEEAHVQLLKAVLQDKAVPKPEFDFTAGGKFPDVFTNYRTFATLAQGFEDTGVRAYKGQAPKLMGVDPILTVALQIHAVEALHAAEVRRLTASPADKEYIVLNNTDVPALRPVYAGEEQVVQLGVNVPAVSGVSPAAVSEAWDEPLTMEQVLAIAGQFIVRR
jgi:hypothetical protein